MIKIQCKTGCPIGRCIIEMCQKESIITKLVDSTLDDVLCPIDGGYNEWDIVDKLPNEDHNV